MFNACFSSKKIIAVVRISPFCVGPNVHFTPAKNYGAVQCSAVQCSQPQAVELDNLSPVEDLVWFGRRGVLEPERCT